MTDETVVEERGITVTKQFDRDGFPVPAVTFRVESDQSEPVTVRIVDEIPEGFGIEQIGFHPEYGSDHWTATGDGVVRFERTVDAGEAFTTVYGVKMADDEGGAPFLGAPTLDVDPESDDGTAVEDVIGSENSDVVRELAEGERDSVPGLDEGSSTGTPAEASATDEEVSAVADDDAEILGEDDTSGTEMDRETETEPEPNAAEAGDRGADPEANSAADEAEILDAGSSGADVPAGDEADETERGADAVDAASEQRTGEDVESARDESMVESTAAGRSAGASENQIDTEETATIDAAASTTDDDPIDEEKSATGDETSIDAAETDATGTTMTEEDRTSDAGEEEDEEPTDAVDHDDLIGRLAADIREGDADADDLATVRAALGDRSESERVRLSHLQGRVADLEAYTDALEAFIDENGRAEEVLDDLEGTVEDLSAAVASIESTVDSAEGERQALRERVETVENEVAAIEDVDQRLERIEGDLAALDERVEDGEEARLAVSDLDDDVASLAAEVDSLDDEVEAVEDEVEAVEEDVEEFKEWRDQLSDLFN
ncbi:MAG: hypothetical protein ABEJ77_02490 [Halanaeroarchaeum sp.]